MEEAGAIRNPQRAIRNGLRVMKFGGVSVGSAERIAAAAAIIAQHSSERPTVTVVSAMSGVTDQLLQTARAAAGGQSAEVERGLAALREKHLQAAAALLDGAERENYQAAVTRILSDVRNTCEGIARLEHCPARSLDAVLGVGEKLSALLLTATLKQRGTAACMLDATALIVTDENFGEAEPLLEPTAARLRQAVPGLLEQGVAPIITGFLGGTADGKPTTLGRGGSDYSATLVAACLDAADVIIWTDVEGIFSADPNLVPNARVLPAVTYQEAAELSYYGAKVLHPKTLAPLAERGIPVWTKSSFRPEAPGTVIARRGSFGLNGESSRARAVTALKHAVLITVESTGRLSAVRLMSRAFSVLAHDGVDLLMLSHASREENFCFAVQAREAEAVQRRIEEAFAVELTHGYVRPLGVQEDVAILALVGSGMRGAVGIAGKLFGALSAAHVNVIAIAQGATETNISVAVEESSLADAVRAVHTALLEN
jgi:aspartokinase/homoserine dehydrogenase 1